MDREEVSRWFEHYLSTFAACGRGEQEIPAMLNYYGVPLILTTDSGVSLVSQEEDVLVGMQQQVDGMLAAGYNRSEVLASEVRVLNETSALYRGDFSRLREDGTEIGRLTATYLITDTPVGLRISALAVHSPA
jgi:hypothetical protein